MKNCPDCEQENYFEHCDICKHCEDCCESEECDCCGSLDYTHD